MIPNIVHFICVQEAPPPREFLYVFYLAVLSAVKVNQPEVVYFYYNIEPVGYWWEQTKPYLTLVKVGLPDEISGIPLIKTPHKVDILRMEILIELGGIYLDMDTICCRPWKNLLANKVVLGKEPGPGICNAIMFCEQKSDFMKYWENLYDRFFNPKGWNEASCLLPMQIAPFFEVCIMPEEAFFLPYWEQIDQIFEKDVEIHPELITLHLWNSTKESAQIVNQITPEWIKEHPQTLYSKIVHSVFGEIPGLNEMN